MEAMSFVTEDRKPAQESTFPNTYTFDLFGGVDVSDIIPKCKKQQNLLVLNSTESTKEQMFFTKFIACFFTVCVCK